MVSGPVPKSDGDAIGVWRVEKWQRLTMGPVNAVLFLFLFLIRSSQYSFPQAVYNLTRRIR